MECLGLYDIIKICGIAVIAVVLGAILKHQGSNLSKYLSETASIIILLAVVLTLDPLIELLKSAFDSKISGIEMLPILLKASIIALICQFTSDICKEHNENMLSSSVEFAGNAAIIILSLPVLKALLTDVFSLIEV